MPEANGWETALEVVVKGTPDSCLTATHAYFVRDWPYPGSVHRNENTVWYVEAQRRTLIDSAGGIILLVLLSLITGGAFFVVWVLWALIRDAGDSDRAQLLATAETPGTVRLTVTATNSKYGTTLSEWVQSELADNEAAAVEVILEQSATNAQTNGGSIPDQIRQLAELRDAGAITSEEYEAKKADLLDRM